MGLDCRNQQIGIAGPLVEDFIVDLVFCLLQLDHLAELSGLGGLSLADNFRRRLEQADDLAFAPRLSAEDLRSRLPHHLLDARHGTIINNSIARRHAVMTLNLVLRIKQGYQPSSHVRGIPAQVISFTELMY